jgi:hypothetical protein
MITTQVLAGKLNDSGKFELLKFWLVVAIMGLTSGI